MTDSDIMINVSFSNDAQKRGPQAGKSKKRNVWFRRKIQYLERKGCLGGKYTHNHKMEQSRCDRAPQRHNGAATKHPSHPTATPDEGSPPGSSTSAPSSPAHSLPSSSVSVNKSSSGHTSARIPTKYVAMDCEMVGSGPKGHISQLARCSIVSYHGDVVYDKFIKPAMPVTDYRTRWSGIQKKDLVNATPFSVAKKEVVKLLMGKVVVGHAVHNDFKVLGYSHPAALTRDTSRIPLLNRKAGFAERECASLKRLTKAIFNRDIQVGKKGHSSVEDAKATMELYKVVEEEWERHLAS